MSGVNGYPRVGLILTTFDDMPEAGEAYNSLWETQSECPFRIVVIDAGSTDDTLSFFFKNHENEIFYNLQHLSKALNAGIQHFIDMGMDYVGWVHPDMLFPQKDWLAVLVHLLGKDDSIGKLAPDDWGSGRADMRAGNACPWLIPTHVLEDQKLIHGFCFDEQFVHCGGYEDWDLNRRIMQRGKKVLITTQSKLKHEGMKSRAKPREQIKGYHNAGRINAGRYNAKWGDDKPPC